MYTKKVVVIGVNNLNLLHLWQIQVLMGDTQPIACFKTLPHTLAVADGVGLLYLTREKPQKSAFMGFKAVYHAQVNPKLADTLQLFGVSLDGKWRVLHTACLPTRRLTAAEVHRRRVQT